MPAIDPDLALRLAKATVDLYADSAQTMLEAVARRLARGIDEPNWETTKLLEQLRLRDEAAAVLERLQVLGPDAIEQAITEAYRTGSKTAASQLGVTATFGMTNTRAVAELVSETVSAVQSTHVQILRSTQDVYRQVISETSSRVVTGTQTRRQAAQSALDRFANKGVTGFVDSAGRNWNLESYTEMAMRTSTGHAQIAGALDRFEDEGNDLVIVSDAPQECRKCRSWEGKVLSVSGRTPGYPTVADARADGLFHANCRHALNVYVKGLTRRMTHTADPEGDAARQEQRRLERGIRQWKRRSAVALDETAKRLADAKVREWQAALREHVKANNLKRLSYREQIGSAI